MENIGEGTLIAIAGLAVAIVTAAYTALQTRWSKNSIVGSQSATALKDFLAELFDSLPHPIVFPDQKDEQGKNVNFVSLAQAREWAWDKYQTDRNGWRKVSGVANRTATENHIAYAIGIRLQQLGAACFSGAVPLRLVVNAYGSIVVQDWLLSAEFIRTLRARENSRSTDWRQLHFHRRHAEWLALTCYLSLKSNWTNASLADFEAEHALCAHGCTPAELAKRYCDVELELMAPEALEAFEHITNVEVVSDPFRRARCGHTVNRVI